MSELTHEPDLLDYAAAQQAKESAIDLVEAGAGEDAIARGCEDVLRLVCGKTFPLTQPFEFTTDDVVWTVKFEEPRAMGAVMRRLQKQGRIEATDRTRPSNSKTCHGRPKRVWRFKQ